MFDIIEACKQYAKDNADANGQAMELELPDDLNETVQYTSNLWPDGVPVTKMFERNRRVRLMIAKGTKLQGVTYTGRASGSEIFEFLWKGSWYRSFTLSDRFGEMTEILLRFGANLHPFLIG